MVADYSRIIDLDPNKHANYYLDRAYAYAAQGAEEKALADYAEFLKVRPKDPGGLDQRGKYYERLGRWSEALADYNEIFEGLKVRPNPFYAFTMLERRSNVSERLGKLNEALADCVEATQLRPLEFAAWEKLGNFYVRHNQWDKALAVYAEVLQKYPAHAQARNNLAWLLVTCPDVRCTTPGGRSRRSRKNPCSW